MACILVTRPEPGAGRTGGRLRTLGHDMLATPLFRVHSMKWTPPGERVDALMLTSANAVRLAGPLPARFRSLPCYAVGRVTADAAETHGFSHVVAGEGDAEALVARMAADGIATALHLAGRDHRAVQPSGLHIITRIVYAADAVERLPDEVAAMLKAGRVDRVLLYSARAAGVFAALADAAGVERGGVSIGALSPAVAAAAGEGWAAVAVADVPREDRLFAACGLLCENGEISKNAPGAGRL